jgi:hypothetical protein
MRSAEVAEDLRVIDALLGAAPFPRSSRGRTLPALEARVEQRRFIPGQPNPF